MTRRISILAILTGLTAVAVPDAGGAQTPAPAVPATAREWQEAFPLDTLAAAALVREVRARQPLAFGDELYSTIVELAFRLSVDPPGMRPPWGRPPPPCDAEACEVLRAGLEGTPFPGDTFSFVVRWAMDPVMWSDSLLARADSASAIFAQAREIALAALAPARSSPHALPAPDATWQEWRDWPGVFGSDRRAHYKIDLARLLMGRDVPSEIARLYGTATSDSARLVLGFRALRLNVVDVSVEDAIRDLGSPSPIIRRLGLLEVEDLVRKAELADPSIAAELQRRALGIVMDGAQPWEPHAIASEQTRRSIPRSSEVPLRSGDRRIVLLTSDDLVAEVLEAWGADPGVRLMSNDQIQEIEDPPLDLSIVTVRPVTTLGPFAWLRVSSEFRAAGPRQRTSLYSYSETSYGLTLMRDANGLWRVLEAEAVVSH